MPSSKSTQSFVPVEEVRNGVIVLKSGGYRSILMVSSLNFALKSEDEQRAIIGGFQNFLNTLDFSVQIVVHSRKMDIRPYLALLAERESHQESELMRIQLREYAAFIRNFVDGSDIMTKTFYVVVPYTTVSVGQVAAGLPFFGSRAASGSNSGAGGSAADSAFEETRVQLEQRVSLVASGLAACGLRAVPLGTEEIIELLYRSFNVGDASNPIALTA